MIGFVVLALILAIGVLLLLNERRHKPQQGPNPVFDELVRKHGDPLPRKHSRPLPSKAGGR